MANHCVEFGCYECGYTWCARGCNYEGYLSQEKINELKKNHKNEDGEECPKCRKVHSFIV